MRRNRVRSKNYLRECQQQLQEAKEVALEKIGIYVTGEAMDRSPVLTGQLRDSNGYQVEAEEGKVIVGNSASHSIFVHEGGGSRRPQRFLEDAVMQNTSRINQLINETYKEKLRG